MVIYLTEEQLCGLEDLLPESTESAFVELSDTNPIQGAKVTAMGHTETTTIGIPYYRAVNLRGER